MNGVNGNYNSQNEISKPKGQNSSNNLIEINFANGQNPNQD